MGRPSERFGRRTGIWMVNVSANQDAFSRVRALPGCTRSLVAFALLFLGLIVIFHEAARSMALQWIGSSTYHHGIIIAPISVWLIVRQEDLRRLSPFADWAGIPVMFAASAVWLAGRAASVDLLAHLSLVLSFVAAAISVFGRELAIRWSFALAFLFFMVPFGDELTPLLQRWASIAVAAALNLTGIETARDGFMLTSSAGRFEMAASCAGLRFLLASAVTSSVVASLAFAGLRKRAAFVVAALAVAIIANWVRAYFIILLATLTDRQFGIGPEHVALGWGFYCLLIAALILAARLLGDIRSVAKASVTSPRRAPATLELVAGCFLIIAAGAAAYDRVAVSAFRPLHMPPALPALKADGFLPASGADVRDASPGAADLYRTTHYSSVSGEEKIIVAAAFYAEDRRGAEITGAAFAAGEGSGWREVEIRTVDALVNGAKLPLRIESLENSRGQKIDVAKLYWLGDRYYASSASLKLAIAIAKLGGRSPNGGVFFVAANHDGEADPIAAIKLFLANTQSIADWRSSFSPSR